LNFVSADTTQFMPGFQHLPEGSKARQCAEALSVLGDLTHSWQDYYAHALTVTNGSVTPVVWAVGISGGNPETDLAYIQPPIFSQKIERSGFLGYKRIILPGDEHGLTEPAERDLPGGTALREEAAVDFVLDRYTGFLDAWLKKCKCCCSQQ